LPALSGGELTTWRTTPTSVQFHCFLHQPVVVFQADYLDDGSYTFPKEYIQYENISLGAYTDIKDGMTLLIGSTAGADDLGRVRVRKSSAGYVALDDPEVIYIDRASKGINDGEIHPNDTAFITVIDMRMLWAVPPKQIDTFFLKYSDYLYNATTSYPPVANASPDCLHVLDNIGDTVSITFPTPSFKTNPSIGSSLTYAWTFPDTTTSTDASPTWVAEADTVGYVELTVTDAAGTTDTAWAFVAVVNKAHANLIHGFTIEPSRLTPEGHELNIRFDEAIPYSTYPDGTEILISQRERYGSTVTNLGGATGRKHMWFAGWLAQVTTQGQASRTGFIARTRIRCVDAVGKLKTLPGFPELVERESAGTLWQHMKSANLDLYVHYLLRWNSNVLQRVDFTWSGTGSTYSFTALGSDGGNLYEQADLRTQAISYKLTCDKNGRLAMKADPQLRDSGDRTSTVIVPISEADWTGFEYTFNRFPRVHWNWGEAVLVSTDDASDNVDVQTVFCVAPGEAPGQGVGSQTSGQQLAVSQAELNTREKHRYQVRMNPYYSNVVTTLGRVGDAGIDPALMEWVQFEITSSRAGQRGRTISSTTRFLPTEVSYEYDHKGGLRRQRVSMEREAEGYGVATYHPPDTTSTLPPYVYEPYTPPVIIMPDDWGASLSRGGTSLAMLLSDGTIANTINFGAGGGAGTNWAVHTPGFTGNVLYGVGEPETPSKIYVLTESRIQNVSDVRGTPAISSSHNLPAGGGAWQGSIETERTTTSPVVATIHDGAGSGANGQYAVYSTNNGGAFTNYQITTVEFTTGGFPHVAPVAVSAHTGNVYTSIPITDLVIGSRNADGRVANVSNLSSWSASSKFDTGKALSDQLHFPYADTGDNTAWCNFVSTTNPDTGSFLYRYISGVGVDKSPTQSGISYSMRGNFARHALDTFVGDKRRVAFVGAGSSSSGDRFAYGLWISTDEGNTWTLRIAPAAAGVPPGAAGTGIKVPLGCDIAGNDANFLYVHGTDGYIAYSPDFGQTWVDCTGDLVTSAYVVRIF
jgi:hypothetical protein